MSGELRRNRRAEPEQTPALAEAQEPVEIQEPTLATADEEPTLDGQEPDLQWAPAVPLRKGYGGSALSFSLAGLAASFFVGWAFPLALIGVVLGIFGVVKREESTVLGVWAIALGTLALVYSAGWLWWANTELHWF